MLHRARQIEIETQIVEMLEDYNLAIYPISIKRVIDALDIGLVPYSSLGGERELALSASEDAFGIRNNDFTLAKVAVNDTEGSFFTRSRFSGGHEIGHIHLEHRDNSPDREDEADYYSGYLLAPHPLILTMPSESLLAKRFGISQHCANIARRQAEARRRESGPWLPHEKWLLENARWIGGGLLGRA